MRKNGKLEDAQAVIVARVQERFARYRQRTVAETDRMFTKLFIGQWLFAILIALVISPYAWEGRVRVVHMHVWIAIFLGGAIASFPVALTILKTGAVATRYVVAVAQMLYSALLIHLTGGRIETHFHVFGSLALLAFYLDWGVLVTAAVTIALDHYVRGLIWPESIYGITNPEWWRFLEHGFWVACCTVSLILFCHRSLRGWLAAAEETGMIEAMAESEWQSVLDDQPKKTGSD